ncbi:MAG TPA: hypothetical protein VFE03_08455 [Caulobacteraceae bacterium]|nr:hypothetical protein [Caulobacteraceae bacterium]
MSYQSIATLVARGSRLGVRSLKTAATLAVISSMVASCADAPDKISANYVSPVQYSNLDCNQIREEMMRVASQTRILVGKQQKKHKNDQVAMGVGLVVFWPALFFIIGGDKKEELAELKGQYAALENVATQKNCAVMDELKQAGAPPSHTPVSPAPAP